MLENRMSELKTNIIQYTSLIESMLEYSINGLLEKDEVKLKKVIGDFEHTSNTLEVQIDEECVSIIAQFQPVARDLRTILMILKINNDLERMGDHCVNIAHSGLFLIQRPEIKKMIDLPRMSEITKNMVKDSIDAFINENAELAKDVFKRDDTVDGLRNQIVRELISYMADDSAKIERSIRLIEIARNFERIADLANNIAEDVVFIIEGVNIKHAKNEYFNKKNN